MSNLITAHEVIRYSPAGKDYPTDWICQLIPVIEQQYGDTCLGETLYNWLQDNVSEVPDGVCEWSCNSSYDTGDYVIRNGCLFESQTDLNTTDPLIDPDETWKVPNRFGNDDCANEFWEKHLRKILALKIYAQSLTGNTLKAGANGLTELDSGGGFNGQGFKTSGKGVMSDYKNDLNHTLELLTQNMVIWVERKIRDNVTCEIPLSSMLLCSNGNCQPNTNSRRRYSFKV